MTIVIVPRQERASVLYEKYERLALSAASAVSKYTRVAYSELEDEARSFLAELVLERWGEFRRNKARASTWIRLKVYFHLRNYAGRRWKRQQRERGLTLKDNLLAKREAPSEGLLPEMKEEGWVLVQLVLEAPGELVGALRDSCPTRSATALKQYLLRARWKPETISRAWAQVQAAL